MRNEGMKSKKSVIGKMVHVKGAYGSIREIRGDYVYVTYPATQHVFRYSFSQSFIDFIFDCDEDFQTFNDVVTEMKNREIQRIIKRRKIADLVHVTFEDNLERILQEGIKPRATLEQEGKPFLFSDKNRNDGKTGYTCLSVTQPNWTYFRKDEFADKNIVEIYISPSVLCQKKDVFFCPHNAASASISTAMKEMKLREARDFENMFNECVHVNYATKEAKTFERNNIQKSNEPTSVQAEILFREIIGQDHFNRIVFQDEPKRDIKDLLKQLSIEYSVKRSEMIDEEIMF